MLERLNLGGRRAPPVILQDEVAECGLASLAMAAGFHGKHFKLSELRQQFDTSLQGHTLYDIIEIAERLGFRAQAYRLELDEIEKIKLPAILHWDMNHFVLLVEYNKAGVVIHDPARGRRSMSLHDISPHFTGVALELEPSANFTQRKASPPIKLRDVVGRTVGLHKVLFQILLLSLILESFSVLTPMLSQLVIDQVLLTSELGLLAVLSIGSILLLITQTAVRTLRDWTVMVMGTHFNLQWVSNLFTHLVKLPMAYFEKRHIGDVQSRFSGVQAIQNAVTTQVVTVLLDGLMSIVGLIMLLIYYPPVAAVALVGLILFIALRAIYYEPIRALSEEQAVRGAKVSSHFLETLRGMQTIRLFGAEVIRRSGWQTLTIDNFNSGIKLQKYMITFSILNTAVFGLEGIAIMWLAAYAVIEKEITVGMLFAIIAYKDQFSSRAGSLVEQFFSIKLLQVQTERLADIVFEPAEQHRDGRPGVSVCEGNLEVENLSFSYAGAASPVFSNCSFAVKAGESIAIVGPSGSGKTTLLKVLAGLHMPNQGKFRIDGNEVTELGLIEYRKHVSSVMQDDQLFSGSIAENIAFFSERLDWPWIYECAMMASVHDDIEAMPMRYQTLIGDMGTTLSGGQKQRILLARALYRRPKILLLDEATSHLDSDNEQRVNEAIKRLAISRIIVAHRPSTIAMADRVLELKGGHIFPATPPRAEVGSGRAVNLVN